MLQTTSLVAALLLAAPTLAQSTTHTTTRASAEQEAQRPAPDAELVLPPSLVEHFLRIDADSGRVAPPADATGLTSVYKTELTAPDATMVRVRFDELTLSGRVGSPDAALLAITSLTDGAVQYLDADSARQWGLHTAYFNGDSVRVELLAAPGAGTSRVRIAGLIASERAQGEPRSLCGTIDDRTLSNDPRAGRLMPIGCTAWLFDGRSNCLITAGHCGPATNSVMQFNVPLSSTGGTPIAPPPEDQYPVDPASIQTNGGGGVGNDWATFGVFDNSNTGLSPLAAQGDSYTLADQAPPVAGQTIRVSGYGSTSSPVPATWYLVQKTHSGPYVFNSNNTIRYAMDTTGGNSGSAVLDESTGLVIGIHTHAGCNDLGGNQGTDIGFAPLQNALENPQGVCVPPGLSFSYPEGLPASVKPDGSTTLRVAIATDEGVDLDTSSARLHIITATLGETVVVLTESSPGVFEGSFPPSVCGSVVSYYVTGADAEGGAYADPRGAPEASYTTYSADAIDVAADFDFESAPGWTVVNDPSLTTGAWEIDTPLNGGRGDPAIDFDGSGMCFLTDNSSTTADVDGGPTRLVSPPFDLSGATDPIMTFAGWFSNTAVDSDSLDIELSSDGASWTLVESVSTSAEAWFERAYHIADHVALSSTVHARFSVADSPNNSVVEAGIDAFRIFDIACDEGCNPSDMAVPFGQLDFSDVVAFLDAFAAMNPAADFVAPFGVFDFTDVISFLDTFTNGCP